MTEYTLTMLDTTGIQRYIFGSNRLQENIGGSELVYRATTLWAFHALDESGLQHNVSDGRTPNWKLGTRNIETDESLQAEVIYAGGGNTLILFRQEEQARQFTQKLTRRILSDAPGLNLIAQHSQVKWEQEKVHEKRKELIKALGGHKQSRLPSVPYLGLGVTAVCESTGLPAVCNTAGYIEVDRGRVQLKLSEDEETRLVSSEIAYKLGWRNAAQDRLKDQLRISFRRDHNFDFPSDIDNLGRIEGEESYVAVVHADGNSMGKHIDQIAKNISWEDTPRGNRQYILELRRFSGSVNAASQKALQSVIKQLDDSIEWDENYQQYRVSETVPLAENRWFPFRPLVFGGDDVTFICNGQIGLALAAAYLEAFERETVNLGLPPMHACAGVAMVKMHYPFARAYQLSEQLCAQAKLMTRETDCSALDWHFAVSGLSGSLGAIRTREYESGAGKLYLRPLRLRAAEHEQEGRYWVDGLERMLRQFQDSDDWMKRRNKVKGLREPLRAGPLVVEKFRRDFDLPLLPELLPGNRSHRENGWFGKQCIYFDAIELMDHYVPLLAQEVMA
jgi:hypothetical protein